MVGQRLLDRLVSESSDFDVTVLCEEPRAAYDRVQLSAFFSGKSADDLSLVQPGFFDRHGIAIHFKACAVKIDRVTREVHTASGQVVPYDKLVLATGSFPFVPPIPGKDRSHCYVYRTIEDLEAIKAGASDAKVGVVIGGGLLGLEAAKALKDLGLQTQVVEFAPRLMAVQVDDGGGRVLRQKIAELGVGIHTNKNTTAIVDGVNARHQMTFSDGSSLETDLIVFPPASALAMNSRASVGWK